jgi:hypothetical protein
LNAEETRSARFCTILRVSRVRVRDPQCPDPIFYADPMTAAVKALGMT